LWGGNKGLVKIFLGLNIAPFSNLRINGLNNESNKKEASNKPDTYLNAMTSR